MDNFNKPFFKANLRYQPKTGTNIAYLQSDNWDDFTYKTLFELIVFDRDGNRFEIGGVKIAYFGQTPSFDSHTAIPDTFDVLEEKYFSLGQGEDYYDELNKLPENLKEKILIGLRDIVYNDEIREKALFEKVTMTSLLRFVSESSLSGQLKRLVKGGALLTNYAFDFEIMQNRNTAGLNLSFSVIPDSTPPTNIHVLIGRNGVGKTFILNSMIKTLLSDYSQNNNSDKKPAIFSFKQKNDCDFAGVISVAFSAFDDFVPMDESSQREKGFKYSYVGLKRTTNSGGKERGSPMSSRMLTGSFIKSFKNCLAQKKDDKLLEVLDELYSDPMFSENLRKTLTANNIQKNNCITELKTIYNKMSSGHRIVLLTITKLVEKVEEKTLILIDEPESHLHPPLLSALVRAISNLLTSKNGVAIIATHSPVVLQEVPNECVWKISRSGNSAKAERPKNETFGESIGILTSEIFGLEVTESGFHKLLKEAIQPNIPYEEALGSFNNKLGAEARIILRSLIANNKR